jgi:hypothetical protein
MAAENNEDKEDPRDVVLPEELSAVDELARLLEQYQTYLLAGSPFADSVRPQAGSAAGTARPTLERLHPKGAAGVAHLEEALRRPQTDDERKTILEEVGGALKEIRALLAGARLRRVAASRQAAIPAAAAPAAAAAVVKPAQKTELARGRSSAAIWVGGGLAVGVALGAFGRSLPSSGGAIERVWHVLEPIIATGSGAHIGNVVFHVMDGEPLRDMIRRRWVGIVTSLLLLVLTAPTAVNAARDLWGPGEKPEPLQRGVVAPAPQPPAPAPAQPPAVKADDAPKQAPSTPPDVDARPSGRSTPGAAPAPPPQATTPAKAPQEPRRPAECSSILQRQQLGEELTAQEKEFYQTRCRG